MRFKLILCLCLFQQWSLALAQMLNPPYFNLAEGRNITASSTCGENVPERELYCKLVGSNWLNNTDNFNLIEGQACDYCDPNDEKRAHPAQYAIDGTERWWQSPPLSRGLKYNEVNLTIDLGQEFNVAYVFIKMGNSPRPGIWVLERSRDHGKTFTPWQYFADTPADCMQHFGQLSWQPITKDNSIICEVKFSKLVPLEEGEIAISLLTGRPSADNFSISATLQDWNTATNIQLRFIRPTTTLGHLLSIARQDPTVTRRYFYSIKDINIGGRCVCNGHASECYQISPLDPYKVSCICQHNTCGSQCEQCCPGYQQYKWRRATINDSFVCEKCNCNGHSNNCYYDEEIANKSQSMNINEQYVGGGVCLNCQHNTAGINCDKCKDQFYRPYNKPIDAIDVCQPCQCNLRFSTGNCYDGSGLCECRTNYHALNCDKCKEEYYYFPSCEECNCNPAGLVAEFGGCDKVEKGKLCECKDRVKGRICNQCKDLYWNLQMNNPHGCEECHCNPNGTVSQLGLCDSDTGQCICKQNVQGRTCNICTRNTYLLDSSNLFGCGNCDCDIGGSINAECDRRTGQCLCKPRIRGQTCSDTIKATYYPTFYQFLYEAEDWYNPTGYRARFGYDKELFPDYSWRGYATFNYLQKEIFTNISISKVSIYKVIVRYINRNNEPVNGILKFSPNEWMNKKEQSIPIIFEPSASPKLLFVTGQKLTSGTAALGAGPWRISLKSDKYDFYVDYVVLIPQTYYDQSLFKDKPTDPCIFESTNSTCLKYAYPRFPESVQTFNAIDGYTIKDESETKPSIIKDESYNQKLNSDSGFVKLDNKRKNLILDIGSRNNGTYLAVVNYHTPSNLNKTILLDVNLVNVGKNQSKKSLNVLPACPYLFACRHILTNNDGQMLTLDTSNEESYQLKLNLSGEDVDDYDLRIDSIVLVPLDLKWSFDYVKPKYVCTFKNSSCVPANFPSVFEGVKIEAEAESNRDIVFEESEYNQNNINDDIKPKLVKLGNSTQTIDIRGFVTEPGLYSFVLHYYQPNSPSFEVETLIQNGHFYSGTAKVEHCPNVAGCRVILKQRDNNSTFFFIQKNFTITLKPTPASELDFDYILVIPGNDFNEQMLSLAPTDGSKSFLSDCLQSNYYMEPDNMSEYCRSIIFSIVVDFNGGALLCQCNIGGSFDHKCKSFGGQCNCKPNVIGRDCTMCETGYYGFPNCRKCNCPSTAVCHPKTGDCICPKGVTGENCDQCLPLTFGFDKIIGCVDCAGNSHGVENRDLNCNLETGNCTCKSNIVGRICNIFRTVFPIP